MRYNYPMNAPRLFLAVPVLLDDYAGIRDRFSGLLEGRWRDEAGLHATIAFFAGRFSPERVIDAVDSIDRTFEVSALEGWDYFPSARVFVATTRNPSLQMLYERLAPRLELPPAHLAPHVTLMRVKRFSDREAFERECAGSPPSGRLQCEIVLYASRLRPEGSLYIPLHRWSV